MCLKTIFQIFSVIAMLEPVVPLWLERDFSVKPAFTGKLHCSLLFELVAVICCQLSLSLPRRCCEISAVSVIVAVAVLRCRCHCYVGCLSTRLVACRCCVDVPDDSIRCIQLPCRKIWSRDRKNNW